MSGPADYRDEDRAILVKFRRRTRRMRVQSQSGEGPEGGYMVIFGGLQDHCQCEGFRWRATCRHVKMANQLLDLAMNGTAAALSVIENESQPHYEEDGFTVMPDRPGPHKLHDAA